VSTRLTYTGLTEMVQEKLHGVAMVTIEQLFYSLQLPLLCLSGKRGRVAEGVTQQLPAVCTRAHNNEAPYHSFVHRSSTTSVKKVHACMGPGNESDVCPLTHNQNCGTLTD